MRPLLILQIIKFEAFLVNFKHLYSKIKAGNPFAMFFAGDFNGKSQLWWHDGGETPEGLSQVIYEPTHFEPGKKPSCIDIIVTDQPNIVLDSGTSAPLDPFCHHQKIYGKANIRIPPPLPFKRTNTAAIKRRMANFPGFNTIV